jgi:hypothetical protein
LLAAGVGRLDVFPVVQIVGGIDTNDKDDAGLGGNLRRAHDSAPKVVDPDRFVDCPFEAQDPVCRLGAPPSQRHQ